MPATITAGTYRGEMYGIPSRIDGGMLYYRKDLLAAYGLPPPQTWDELARQAGTIVAGESTSNPALRGGGKPEFAAAGWALSLDTHFPPAEQEKFLPATITAGTYRGEMYGIPSRIDGGMLYYRKDLLAAYDLPPPQTWDELARQASTIVAGESTRNPALRGYSAQFKQYEGLVCNMLEFIESNGGR